MLSHTGGVMKIINVALIQVDEMIQEAPIGCSHNLDACQCIETCRISYCA